MKNYEFDIEQYQLTDGTGHSWKAIDRKNGNSIFLNENGGMRKKVGYYPEIEKYLAEEYGEKINLRYNAGNANSKAERRQWEYEQENVHVIINDGSRVILTMKLEPL